MKENILVDLIYTMIDGEASEIERQTLFNALQQNPELQVEFQNAININNAGKSYASSAEVPLHLTNQLFNKSGMVYTGADNLKKITELGSSSYKTVANNGFKTGFGKIAFGKYGFGILGLLIGGFLSIVLLNNANEGSNITQNNQSLTKDLKNVQVISKDNSTFLEKQEAKELPNNDNNYKVIIKYVNKESEIPVTKNSTIDDNIGRNSGNNETNNKVEESLNITLSDIVRELNNLNVIGYANKNPLSGFSKVEYDNSLDLFYPSIHNKTFEIEVNNSFFWNLPEETISPEEISKLHNMNIFLYYLLNNYISLGLGVRQETFYVKYYTSDELSRDFIYEQQPNLTNYEFSVRYKPFYFDIYKPFLQLNFGGGKFGYTYRAGIGSEIKLYDEIAFTLLLEYAELSYRHKSDLYNAKKIGINYGINYNF